MKIKIAIKFGSNEITIYRMGIGIVAREPAFLAVQENKDSIKIKAVGKMAQKLLANSGLSVYQPIKDGEIVNEKYAVILLEQILKDVIIDKSIFAPIYALVSIPSSLGEEAIYKLKKVLSMAGLKNVEFVQNAVSVRENLDLDPQTNIMVVDIGKNLTDISILNSYNFNFGRMYYLGGADMDKSITTFILDNHDLTVSDKDSEALKNELASLYDRDLYTLTYTGLDENNKFVHHPITASEVKVAITNVYDKIIGFIKQILTEIPKEIYAQVYNSGVVFVGGASNIPGLYEYAKKRLDLPIIVHENPTDAVILGAGKLLSKDGYLKINL